MKRRMFSKRSENDNICTNCMKRYNESENMNWSCRTHQSTWSGEMWWCCGKTKQGALGCKYAKHTDKDLSDVDEDEDENFTLKCNLCKQHGHDNTNCDLDPNMRTKVNVEAETSRLENKQTFKRYTMDAVETTTKFLSE
jgi:hypothetical protein